MSILDMGNHTETSDCTADQAAPMDHRSTVKVWEKAALAGEQVNLLIELRDVGVGTHTIESFMKNLVQHWIKQGGSVGQVQTA